jgi:hypothetical protein
MSDILRYEAGQVPARPVTIQVTDEDTGAGYNLIGYSSIVAELIGPKDEFVNIAGLIVDPAEVPSGRVTLRWPTNRSLFDTPGRYYMRLAFYGPGSRDYSETIEIRVSSFGRFN